MVVVAVTIIACVIVVYSSKVDIIIVVIFFVHVDEECARYRASKHVSGLFGGYITLEPRHAV